MHRKKFISSIMMAVVMLTLSACGSAPKDTTTPPTTIQQETTSEDVTDAPSFSNFTSIDLEGNEVNQDIFSNYDLTMINIWGTFCGPCLREMPELGEIAEEYEQKGVQVVGIVMDALDNEGEISDSQVEKAKELVEQTGAHYTHLLPTFDLIHAKLKYINAVPETLFVDKDGNIIGSPIAGARDKKTWISIIEEKLEEVNAQK